MDLATHLVAIVGRPVSNLPLFQQALTHPSYAHEAGSATENNERLEFLGDAVLDLIIAEWLFHTYPDRSEGDLSRMRAALVCTPTLARVARRLSIGTLLRLGQGEAASGGRDRSSLLANALEAVIGALYISEGIEVARECIHQWFAPEMKDAAAGRLWQDYKTRLQEVVQERYGTEPQYRLVRTEGPDHAKVFFVEVLVAGEIVGTGSGRSKKEAEQEAAEAALRRRWAGQ